MSRSGFAALDACVHCGFCLPSCPTYVATYDEADSPRGRIVLMRGIARNALTPDTPTAAYHLDRCLGCRACEPVCPSGVEYGTALEAVRAMLAESRPIPLLARAVNRVMAEPLLRRPLLATARVLRSISGLGAGPSRLRFALGMLTATRPAESPLGGSNGRATTRADPVSPAATETTALFAGCIMDGLFSHVNRAAVRTLSANGYRVVSISGQACCGALHAHTGEHDRCLALARRNVSAFATAPDAPIAVTAAGCGAMLKEYGRVLAGDPLEPAAVSLAARVRDVTELLAQRGPRAGHRLDLRVAYDPPCHLLHAQGISQAPLTVLHAVPHLEYVRHTDADHCCGSAGSYSLTESRLSQTVLARKIEALRTADPDVVATGNPGCIMQIGAGLIAAGRSCVAVHPIEILDWSYERAGYYG